MSLAEALERAAGELAAEAEVIRPANGDPLRVLEGLDAPAAGRLLDWLLRHEAEDAAELVESWAEREEGVALLLAADEAGLPKPGRKLLRRFRHRLRSTGASTPEAEPEQRVATLPSLDDTISEALITPFDPSGARLVYLVEPDPSGGARVFEIALDDRRGILDASVYSAGRSKVRAFLKQVVGRPKLAALQVSPEDVRALVARAAGRHPAERRFPGSFSDWKSHLTAGAAEARTPGDQVREALGESDDAARVRAAAERVEAGEVGPWPEPGEVLGPIAERVRERATSELLVDARQRREQAAAALGDALEEVFDETASAACAERFRETAFLAWKRGEEEEARIWLAAAGAFAAQAPRDNPVARALLEATFAPLLASLEAAPGEAEEPVSPILEK